MLRLIGPSRPTRHRTPHRRSPRRHPRLAGLVVLLVLVPVLLLGARPLPAEAATDPVWGLMDSTCSASDIAANRAVGIGAVEVEAYWDRFLPAGPGVENTAYVADLRNRVTACLDAGIHVVVGTGTQYPPSWVRGLTGAALVDQRGKNPATGAVDTVFS